MSTSSSAAMTAREQVSAPWRLLSTLPSTNWKMVSGTLVAWATLLFMFGLIAYMARGAAHDTIVLSLVDSLLLYAATVGGVLPAAQYALKRGTFKPGGPDDQRAALDVAAAAQDVAIETGQPALPVASAPVRSVPDAPDAALALKAIVAARAASPETPVGILVDGDGD